MKKCIVVLVLLALSGIATFYYYAESGRFTCEDGKFSIVLPGEPERETQTIKTAVGPLNIYGYTVKLDAINYTVSYADYPADLVTPENEHRILDQARDGAIANLNGALVASRDITYEGHPGRAFAIAIQDGAGGVRAKIYLVENRLYQVVAVADRDTIDLPRVGKVLQSFRLTD